MKTPDFQLRKIHKDLILFSFFFRQARPSQVSLGENVIGESAIKTVEEIGTRVKYEFRVRRHLLLTDIHQNDYCIFFSNTNKVQ